MVSRWKDEEVVVNEQKSRGKIRYACNGKLGRLAVEHVQWPLNPTFHPQFIEQLGLIPPEDSRMRRVEPSGRGALGNHVEVAQALDISK